jgi:hypothetical protein
MIDTEKATSLCEFRLEGGKVTLVRMQDLSVERGGVIGLCSAGSRIEFSRVPHPVAGKSQHYTSIDGGNEWKIEMRPFVYENAFTAGERQYTIAGTKVGLVDSKGIRHLGNLPSTPIASGLSRGDGVVILLRSGAVWEASG